VDPVHQVVAVAAEIQDRAVAAEEDDFIARKNNDLVINYQVICLNHPLT